MPLSVHVDLKVSRGTPRQGFSPTMFDRIESFAWIKFNESVNHSQAGDVGGHKRITNASTTLSHLVRLG